MATIEGEPHEADGQINGKDTDNGLTVAEQVSAILLFLYLYGRIDRRGQIITDAVIRHEIDKLVQVVGRRMDLVTRQLLNGDITLGTWQARMANLIRAGNSVTASVARGGIRNMRPADWLRVRELTNNQMRFLNRFAGQLKRASAQPGTTAYGRRFVREPGQVIVTSSGRVLGTENQVLARARSYATSIRSTKNEFERQLMEERGKNVKRVLTARESCEECIAWAGKGFIPAKEMAPIGSLLCGSHCRCYLEVEGE